MIGTAFVAAEGERVQDERFVVLWGKRLLGQPTSPVVTNIATGYSDQNGAASDVVDWWDMTDDGYETVSATITTIDMLTTEQLAEVQAERARYGWEPYTV